MIIDQLPAIASPQAADELPIERGTTTYKIRYDDFGQPLQDQIDAIETDVGDVSNLTTAATNCVDAINEVKTSVTNKILKATTAVTPSTTQQTYSLPGLTTDHELIRWNFKNSGADGAENNPPSNLEWTTGTNQWTLVCGWATAFTCQPVFAIPE